MEACDRLSFKLKLNDVRALLERRLMENYSRDMVLKCNTVGAKISMSTRVSW